MILKHGKREDLLPYARDLLQWIICAKFKIHTGSNVNKLVFKIVQRIGEITKRKLVELFEMIISFLGLIFLAPRLASWRYKRGNRSLSANLSAGDGKAENSNIDTMEKEDENEIGIIVPEEVEEVIDQLVQGLGHADGIVR